MKNLLFLLTLSIILFSCKNDDDAAPDTGVVGTWQLIEIYLDPGDGSGDFEVVSSNKTITFAADGTFFSNGSLCTAANESDMVTNGIYNTATLIMTTSECGITELDITYKIEGENLILRYPCIESCLEKYVKL